MGPSSLVFNTPLQFHVKKAYNLLRKNDHPSLSRIRKSQPMYLVVIGHLSVSASSKNKFSNFLTHTRQKIFIFIKVFVSMREI